MKLSFTVITLLICSFGEAQTKNQLVGKWDVVSQSSDGTIELRKRVFNDNRNRNKFYHFERSGKFSIGPIIRRCLSDPKRNNTIPVIWNWNYNSKELITSLKLSGIKRETIFKVIRLIGNRLTIQEITK